VSQAKGTNTNPRLSAGPASQWQEEITKALNAPDFWMGSAAPLSADTNPYNL